MAASALGGNCELSKAGETVVTDNGVTIIAPENLPASMPVGVGQFYARNISRAAAAAASRTAPSTSTSRRRSPATVITHGGAVVSEAVQKLLAARPEAQGDDASARAALTALHDLRARDPVRLRGHLQGPGHAPHAADVGRELDPRHRPRRRDVHRRRGERPRCATCCRSSPSRSRRSTSSAATSSPTGCSRCSGASPRHPRPRRRRPDRGATRSRRRRPARLAGRRRRLRPRPASG